MLVSANVKGLIFYPKKAWEEAGYPTEVATIDDLNALTEQIKADGNTPWCMGIESDTATGWPATDWFETLVAKYGGAEGYNSWVTHETPFDSDLVREAAAEFEELMFTDGNVLGGREAMASTNFGTAGNPMFDAKPGCWMYNQGSFITGFFPEDILADLDANVGVFGFPPAEAGGENPVIGGGDLAMLLSDSENAKTVMAALAETDIGNDAAGSSSFISPHTDFDASLYPNELTRSYAEVAQRLDGVPVRRLRPDARRGRCRHVLAGHDRVDQRPAGPRHHADEHRRQLARQLTSARKHIVAGGAGLAPAPPAVLF